MKVHLLNDHTASGHFGCIMVGEVYREQFKRLGMEEVDSRRDADLVIVNGEGTVHHHRHRHLVDVATFFPSVFINAVWEDNPPYEAMKAFRYVAVRESLSAQLLHDQGVEVEVVPDIVLTNSRFKDVKWRKERSGIGLTDGIRGRTAGETAHQSPGTFLYWLTQWEGVVCGRFHAALCCAALGVPFSTWDSNTWKIRGLMIDIGKPSLHAKDQDQAIRIVPNRFDDVIRQYVEEGKKKVNAMFDHIATLGG